MRSPTELSLFSGAGGGLLASKLLDCRTVGYVEINKFKQQVLLQRMLDGFLHDAPIFSDIRHFNSRGYADAYSGLVDLITAGFPCQPHSVGRAGGFSPDFNPDDLWPDTFITIGKVRPRFVFLENVRQIIRTGYHTRCLVDLARMGYAAEWGVFRARDVGAPHSRARWFLLAADPTRFGPSWDSLCQVSWVGGVPWGPPARSFEDFVRGPNVPTSRLCGVDDGVANRVDRLEAIGDGQVPQLVWFAFGELMRRLALRLGSMNALCSGDRSFGT